MCAKKYAIKTVVEERVVDWGECRLTEMEKRRISLKRAIIGGGVQCCIWGVLILGTIFPSHAKYNVFTNLWDLFHISIMESAHWKHLENAVHHLLATLVRCLCHYTAVLTVLCSIFLCICYMQVTIKLIIIDASIWLLSHTTGTLSTRM